MEELVPLGTVVTLKDGDKRLMVVGRLQKAKEQETVYDYAACLWPEGLIDSQHFYLFNHKDIKNFYYIGLQDTMEFNFRYELERQYKEMKKGGSK